MDASEGAVRGQRLLELTCLEYRAHLLDSLVVVHGVCEAFPGSPEIHWVLVLQVSAVGAVLAVVHGGDPGGGVHGDVVELVRLPALKLFPGAEQLCSQLLV